MKKTRIVSIILVLALIVPMTVFPSDARTDAKYSIEEYVFDAMPRSLVVSYYNGILSRGFAWYTDEATEATELYVAEGVHGADYDFENLGINCSQAASSNVVCDPEVPDVRVRSHHAYIEALKSGTYYSYKLGGAGNFVHGVFKTDSDESDFTMINFTDPQTKDPSKLNYWENTVATAFRTVGSNVDFVYNGGDLYDHNMKPETVSRFYRWGAGVDTLGAYSGSVPVLYAGGNHEANTEKMYTSGNCVNFAGVTSDNTSAYYSFDYGPVHFVVLAWIYQTNSADFKAEMEWLKADLSADDNNPDTKWRVVCAHWGPHGTGEQDDSTTRIASKLAPVLSEFHVDLMIQGHLHTFSKTLPYFWDTKGFSTMPRGIDKIVNFEPATVDIAGVTYQDCTNNGTYYISSGASGHRIGESCDYAYPDGGYTKAPVQIKLAEINVDSPYAKIGEKATRDFNETTFGVMNVAGNALKYDFYVATENGEAVLVDTLRLYKGDGTDIKAADEFNEKVLSHKNDKSALESDCNEYVALSKGVRALLSDEAIELIDSVRKTTDTIEITGETQATAVIASQKSVAENGKQNIRFIAETDVSSTSCAFEITYYLDGNAKTTTVECQTVYSKKVTLSDELGFTKSYNVSPGKLAFAVTVTDVPVGAIISVRSVATNARGAAVNSDSVTVVAG